VNQIFDFHFFLVVIFLVLSVWSTVDNLQIFGGKSKHFPRIVCKLSTVDHTDKTEKMTTKKK